MKIKFDEGDIFLLSYGEYSDYYVQKIVRAVKDFDSSVVDEIVKTGRLEGMVEENVQALFDFLLKGGYIEEMPYAEITVVDSGDGIDFVGKNGSRSSVQKLVGLWDE